MFGRVLLAAILAGIAAGLVMAIIQYDRLTPLILQAETFEHVAHGHSGEAHSHGEETWSPANGIERKFYTSLTSILTAVGFAFAMAGLSLVGKRPVTFSNGWLWGLCGFAIVSFAPAVILPPMLPGMAEQAFNLRMFGWIGAIVMTGMGVWGLTNTTRKNMQSASWPLICFAPILGWKFFIVPNDVNIPSALSAHFVMSSLVANLAMWLIIGAVLGFLFDRWKLNHD